MADNRQVYRYMGMTGPLYQENDIDDLANGKVAGIQTHWGLTKQRGTGVHGEAGTGD